MILNEFIPDPRLQKYIHRFSIVTSVDAMPAEKCVMDGFVKLFIYLNDNLPEYYDTAGNRRDWGDGVGGHQTGLDLYIQTPAQLKLAFCIFKPAGFYRLFKVPIHLLNNDIAPLEVFLGSRTREFKERMVSAADDEARIAVINDFFLSLARKLPETYPLTIEHAQDRLLQKNGILKIEGLSNQLNVSRRSLERHFLENIGIPPKYYAQVLRFNYAFGLKRSDPALDWFDIIHDCGYFDQTHFIKEFRHFTGQPPVAFYREEHPIDSVYVGRAAKHLK